MRHAGGRRGMVNLIAALGDNPLTRSWSDLVTGAVIQPWERFLLGPGVESRDTQRRLARAVAADLHSHNGELSPSMAALLREHVDPQLDVARLNQATARMDAAGLDQEERAVQINTLLAQGPYHPGLVERGNVDAGRTAALRQAVLAGQPLRRAARPRQARRRPQV